jgi:hypothetical protein
MQHFFNPKFCLYNTFLPLKTSAALIKTLALSPGISEGNPAALPGLIATRARDILRPGTILLPAHKV